MSICAIWIRKTTKKQKLEAIETANNSRVVLQIRKMYINSCIIKTRSFEVELFPIPHNFTNILQLHRVGIYLFRFFFPQLLSVLSYCLCMGTIWSSVTWSMYELWATKTRCIFFLMNTYSLVSSAGVHKINEKRNKLHTTFVLATERQNPCVNFRGKNIIESMRTTVRYSHRLQRVSDAVVNVLPLFLLLLYCKWIWTYVCPCRTVMHSNEWDNDIGNSMIRTRRYIVSSILLLLLLLLKSRVCRKRRRQWPIRNIHLL